MMRVWT